MDQKHVSLKVQNTFVNIKNPYDRGRASGFKKAMSKRRWTRKLGSLLFGWKWKKVKKNSY